jgi:hypothetical protein
VYDAFGDESCGDQWVAYGLLLLPEREVEAATKILAEVKVAFAGQPAHPLHCRQIFAGDARRRSPWAHLKIDDVFKLYEVLFARLAATHPRRILVVARRADFPAVLPPMAMQHVDPSSGIPPRWTKEMPLGPKQLAVQCAQGAMIPLSKTPGLDKVRFHSDPDETKIDWFDRKRSATNAISPFFVDVGPDQEPEKGTVVRTSGQKPELLQVADAIAYIGQRGMSSKHSHNDQRFKALYQAIAPEKIRYMVGRDGGFGFDVPNSSLTQTMTGRNVL